MYTNYKILINIKLLISQDPVIGFVQFWIFLKALVDLSMYQFIEGLVKNLWRYCVSKIGYSVHYIVYYFLLNL